MSKMYYFGYGMNTNTSGMRGRCPAAISMGSAVLYDHDFRFAIHADVVPRGGHKVNGVLWEVTDRCMASLDRLESCYRDKDGKCDSSSYYDRKIVQVLHRGVWYDAWVYFMLPGIQESPPGDSYWNCLMEGYKEHNVSRKQLHQALEQAKLNRPPTYTGYHYDRWTYRPGTPNKIKVDSSVPF